MTIAGRPYRRHRQITVVSLLLLVLSMTFGPTPSSAAGAEWWVPTARPAPDSQINVTGAPFTGTDSAGDVRGFVDAHNHLFSNEAFGGRLICGKVFSEAGVADALKDCPEHYPDGTLAIFDYITHGGDGRHDPVGWPTFKDWPAVRLDDPSGELLRLGGARLARRTARPGQRPRHQRHDLLGLPLQGPQLRRDDVDPPPGEADVRPPGVHRQAVRRHGQGLVPDRHRQRAGPPGHRAGQARGHPGRGDLRAVRLQADPGHRAVQQGRHRRRARRAVRAGCAQHVPVPQVRQRAVRRPLRRARTRYGHQRRAVPVDRYLLADREVHGSAEGQPHRPGGVGGREGPRRAAPRSPPTTRTPSATSAGSPTSASTPYAA